MMNAADDFRKHGSVCKTCRRLSNENAFFSVKLSGYSVVLGVIKFLH